MENNIVSLYGGKIKIRFSNDKWHTYTNLDTGEKIKSVTKVIGVMDKPALKFWAANIGADYLWENWEDGKVYSKDEKIALCKGVSMRHNIFKEEQAGIGTAIHQYAEDYVNGKNPKLPEDEKIKNGAIAFIKFWEDNNFIPTQTERIAYSLKNNIIGIADLDAKKGKGKNVTYHIIDYKAVSVFKKCREWEKEKWPDGFVRDEKTGEKVKYPVFDGPKIQVSAYRAFLMEETGLPYDDSYVVRFDKDTGEFDLTVVTAEEQDIAYKEVFEPLIKANNWLSNYGVKY